MLQRGGAGRGAGVIGAGGAAVQWPAVKRRLFTILSALSLLLFAAVVALWVWSYFRSESISRVRSGGIKERISAASGSIIASRTDGHRGEPDWFHERYVVYSSPPLSPDSVMPDPHLRGGEFAGFAWYYYGPEVHWTIDRLLIVPYWFVAMLTAIHPACLGVRWYSSHRRHARGLCPSCGYDLRATPGRCPECGTGAATSTF